MLIGGVHLAAFSAAAVAFAAVALAVRGWIGAFRYVPLHACFLAPVALIERSISLYWALLRRFSGIDDPRRVPVLERSRNERAASGR